MREPVAREVEQDVVRENWIDYQQRWLVTCTHKQLHVPASGQGSLWGVNSQDVNTRTMIIIGTYLFRLN